MRITDTTEKGIESSMVDSLACEADYVEGGPEGLGTPFRAEKPQQNTPSLCGYAREPVDLSIGTNS